jgi:hypothetical protein
MKKHPLEYNSNLCWCGHNALDHADYVEYTGWICQKCSCGDFALTEFSE